ncbi:LOW QUALITY PROTEIN: hypothetical protein PanWU01x14_025860 [Parasponia andersonii]|uniref:Uncharacterized protein n=1 Tax=Parasponia andersonii TaxID=3476 RepID=A0A2P5DVX1_PARAD|nr:LOW QUALITY PROTEIN: hypothetical protein PanWU01x14_025860 [Parasponia andersonii]
MRKLVKNEAKQPIEVKEEENCSRLFINSWWASKDRGAD